MRVHREREEFKLRTIIVLALLYVLIMCFGEPRFGATFWGKTAHDPRKDVVADEPR